MKHVLLFLTAALLLSSCGGNSGNKIGASVEIAQENGLFGLKQGAKWIAEPVYVEIKAAGQLFIAYEGYKKISVYTTPEGLHLYDNKGKLLFQSEGFIKAGSGNFAIIYTMVEIPETPYHKNKSFAFSFATMQKMPVGYDAIYIKNGAFIQSRDGRKKMFWSLDGRPIWEGEDLNVDYRTDKNDTWVGLLLYHQPALWLDLNTGNTIPHGYGEQDPNLELLGSGNGYEVYDGEFFWEDLEEDLEEGAGEE